MYGMHLDKKVRNGKIQLVLLEKIGQVRLQSEVSEDLLRKVWIGVGAVL
jgi:3-dehydroquinate synthetase